LRFTHKPVIEFALGSQANAYPSSYFIKSAIGVCVMERSVAFPMRPNHYAQNMALITPVKDTG
jgi:hypothetical protein